MNDAIHIRYTNWRGETADRVIRPIRIWFGTTEWHSDWQWLMEATDIAKGEIRHFALADMVFLPTPPDTWHERRTMLPDGDARKEGGK